MILPPIVCFLLPQIYYFVETLPVSAIVSSFRLHQSRPTQPALVSVSKLITRSTDPSLVLILTLIAFSGSGVVFSIFLHDWSALQCLLIVFVLRSYLSICDTQPALMIRIRSQLCAHSQLSAGPIFIGNRFYIL